jgi:hypothetical protein
MVLNSAPALLGVVGSVTATVVAGWVSPILGGLSVALLSRSFYVLYVKKSGTGVAKVITWTSACFVVGFWSWWFLRRLWGE